MSSTSSRGSVSFGIVEIREHEIELGDNPSVSGGMPLTLGWRPIRSSIREVDEYEHLRSECRQGRRRIPAQERSSLLQASGYSMEDFAVIALEIQMIKQQRSESSRDWDWSFSLQRRKLIRAVLKNAAADLEFVIPSYSGQAPQPAIGCNGLRSIVSPLDVPVNPYLESVGGFDLVSRPQSVTRIGIL